MNYYNLPETEKPIHIQNTNAIYALELLALSKLFRKS